MVNNVIGMVNYVIAARPSLLNFVIADTRERGRDHRRAGAEEFLHAREPKPGIWRGQAHEALTSTGMLTGSATHRRHVGW